MAKRKYYVVWKGRKTGVFSTWDECKEQIGNFTGAIYKSFESLAEAKTAFQSKPHLYVGQKKSSKKFHHHCKRALLNHSWPTGPQR